MSCASTREIPHWIGGGYGVKTIAEVKRVHINEFDNLIVRYVFSVEEEIFEGVYERYFHDRSIVEGRKFYVSYNKYNPNQSRLLIHRPIVDESEDFALAIADVRRVRNITGEDDSPVLRFSYRYHIIENRREYSAVIDLANPRRLDSTELENSYFLVLYNRKNPHFNILIYTYQLKNTEVLYADIDRRIEDKLNRAAQQVGEGGRIIWMPSPDMKSTFEERSLFAKTFTPTCNQGNKMRNVRIQVIPKKIYIDHKKFLQ